MVTTTNFSAILPIHNEERNLPFSLPSIYGLNPNETILLFDRCTDHSVKTAQAITEHYGMSDRTKIVFVNEESEWKNRHAYVSRIGYSMARNDLLLDTAADIILDFKILKYFPLIEKTNVAFISFLYIDYPISFRNLLKRLLVGIGLVPPSHKQKWLAGPHIFSKKAWLETEDQNSVKNVVRAHDTHLHCALLTKYSSRCIKTKTFHLRPRESSSMHYLRGQLYWTVAKRSFLLTLLSALFFLRLKLIKGYIHARNNYYP